MGHVAKSFGLLENPKAVRSGGDDVIGKIFNGHYASAALLTDGTSKNIEASDNGKTLTRAEKKQQRDEKYSLSKTLQKTKRQIQSKGTVHAVKDRQKLRAIGKKPVTVSGKFRKATGGYFKNKLRNQTTSEFSS